ncbi:DedA family protein [Kingella negevensis]|uniref:VTT domain-containing protein n=1 Tax=Kingella negevensis TaxID=1522312 RepID=A0A238HFI6_9NEIS|nr:DedA family protein [Kingella negevensis]MDK4680637.1 DedA family protein [Kingella negevensis]MDK4681640.1 DedA family protein [Kingella negevensis]MDK4683723.1 DedA family protein [Kingella negevensis]MDK4689838.1 DedA family protein [Kingella negevensis]MDK4692818.1 DedA family protein [Kingella negevensis]
MLALLEHFFIEFGYAAVFFVLVLCGFGIPIPEDVTLVAGGVISGLHYTNVHIMVFVGLAGVLVGDGIIFLLGKHFGQRILHFRLIAKLLPPKRYAQVQQKFDQYGNRVLFVARFLPGLRSPIFLTAGMSGKVSFWRWLMMDGFAALISVPIWVYIGDIGAENKDWLMRQIHHFQYGLYVVTGVGGLLFFRYWWKRRRVLIARRDALLEKRRQRRLEREKRKQVKQQ